MKDQNIFYSFLDLMGFTIEVYTLANGEMVIEGEGDNIYTGAHFDKHGKMLLNYMGGQEIKSENARKIATLLTT